MQSNNMVVGVSNNPTTHNESEDNKMDKNVKDSLELITTVLELLNSNLEEIDKRATMLETSKDSNDFEECYIIKIPINASNLDVFRTVFGGVIIESNRLYTHINIDGDTIFHTEWAKTRYRGGENNETNKRKVR